MRLTAVLIAGGALLLAGCAVAPAPLPPQPTDGDWAALTQQRLDYLWQQTGIEDARRPAVHANPAAHPWEATIAFTECMRDRGLPGYAVLDGAVTTTPFSAALPAEERLAWYTCYAENPRTSEIEALRSRAQFDYLYDYYRDSLVPCLERFGARLAEVPTRDQFSLELPVGSVFFMIPAQWSPYDEVAEWAAGHPELARACPALPRGAVGWFSGGAGQELLRAPGAS